ncbi:MAG: M28 family peptidase, partial [Deltaproteobacteria bacterium]|nr:M28 family peptidase [Deltaproteobacteria bacterium]
AVAMVIRVACALVKNPTKRSVIIASWDAEEPPTFLTDEMGSAYWVSKPTVPLAQIDASIVLDLAGGDLWDGFQGHFVLGAEMSPELSAALDAATKPPALELYRFGLHLVEETIAGHQPWSDYHAFRQKGIAVLFITNGQNKRYHTTSDELDSVNLPKMTLEADYLYSMVEKLGNRAGESKPSYHGSTRDDLRDAVALIGVLEAALKPQGLIKFIGTSSEATLKEDLAKARAIKTKLDGGGTLSSTEVGRLRSAAQRVMCFTGPTYPEYVCNMF